MRYRLVFSLLVWFGNLIAMDYSKYVVVNRNKTLLKLVTEKQLSLPDMQKAIDFFGDNSVHYFCPKTENTPLHCLALRNDSTLEHFALLIDNGASVHAKNNQNETIFDCLVEYKGLTPSEEDENFQLHPIYHQSIYHQFS